MWDNIDIKEMRCVGVELDTVHITTQYLMFSSGHTMAPQSQYTKNELTWTGLWGVEQQ